MTEKETLFYLIHNYTQHNKGCCLLRMCKECPLKRCGNSALEQYEHALATWMERGYDVSELVEELL